MRMPHGPSKARKALQSLPPSSNLNQKGDVASLVALKSD
jgi:hypothetical protein